MPSAKHSSIAQRLAKIPPDLMDRMLAQAQHHLKSQCHWKGPLFPRLKVFDTTTWSVSAKHYQWAADNGHRSAARFVFMMDQRTGAIEQIIDAHQSTSDNDVFERVVRTVRRGDVVVFDRGYNRLSTVKRIREQGGHFVTRWKSDYAWKHSKKRKLRQNRDLDDEWQIIDDEDGTVGSDRNPGQMYARRITCWHPATETEEEKFFIVWTDLFKLSAKKVVQIYLSRWAIEVFFRHVKSSLRTIHVPTRSEAGMHNWLVLVALSVIFMQLLTTSEAKGRIKSLGERHYPLLARWRQVEVLILNEVFLSLRQEPRKPPPRLKSKPRPSASTKLIDPDLSSPLPSLAFQGGTIPVAPP